MSDYIIVHFALHVLAWASHLQEDSDTKECVFEGQKYIIVKYVTCIRPNRKITEI
jgi:hypothetical protein